jgi:hypothetical protein
MKLVKQWTWVLASLIVAAPAAASPTVEDLGWLAGSWSGTNQGVKSEEHWTAPQGGLLIGMHRDVKDGKAVGFEFLRIQVHEGAITYLAQPRGREATPFKLKELSANRVVFENPAHDFPQRIIYWKTKRGELGARVEGVIAGEPEAEEWLWTRTSLPR